MNPKKDKKANFDFDILRLFLEENADFLSGARVQKIRQPSRKEIIFEIRNDAQNRKFYANIDPVFFHVCFMSLENEALRYIKIPKSPPMFCMLLRKYLEGAKIFKVAQPQGERILEFYFETYNEVSEKIFLCLAFELMGKHSNIVLYNYDTNVIIGCAHNVGDDKSRQRHLVGGLPYVYPTKSPAKDYFGLSDLFGDKLQGGGSVNGLIDDYFAQMQSAQLIKNLRQKLSNFIAAKLKKISGSLTKFEKSAKTQAKATVYRKKGDLLTANFGMNAGEKAASKVIEIVDWETNLPVKIELDETKTLKENAAKYYKLYNKAKSAGEKSQELIENLRMEKDYLEQALYSVECAETIGDLREIEEEMGTSEKEKVKSEKKVSSPFTFQFSPFTIYVGKNNKQNDYIISKLASDEDLWFHVRQGGGSHVLLKAQKNKEPDEKTVFECAKLAKEHSRAKNSSKVGVIYTKAKYLRKPPCAKLGYVTYKNETEILVD